MRAFDGGYQSTIDECSGFAGDDIGFVCAAVSGRLQNGRLGFVVRSNESSFGVWIVRAAIESLGSCDLAVVAESEVQPGVLAERSCTG